MRKSEARHTQQIIQACMDLGSFDYQDIISHLQKMKKQKGRGRYYYLPSPQRVIQVLRSHTDIREVQDVTKNRTKVYKYVGDYSTDNRPGDCNY